MYSRIVVATKTSQTVKPRQMFGGEVKSDESEKKKLPSLNRGYSHNQQAFPNLKSCKAFERLCVGVIRGAAVFNLQNYLELVAAAILFVSIRKIVMAIQGGIKFDATINLGHILTFLGFVATIFVSWETLDKRLIVLESAAKTQAVIDQSQDEKVNTNNQHISESLTDIKKSIERLNDKLDRKP